MFSTPASSIQAAPPSESASPRTAAAPQPPRRANFPAHTVRRTLTVCLILLIALSAARASTPHNVAPNTVERAYARAADAVVKLHGGRLGREQGYGTGFLVSADGQIVTSLSLLVMSPRIRAVLADGREFLAERLRTDENRKLALLKIDASSLPFLELAPSDGLQAGDTVIALGNWYKIADGREPISVNRGILSQKTNLDAQRLTQEFDYAGPVLIYDAITSNPGAPGGPLLDVDGNCVGIIGRIVEAQSTLTRINYSLPSEEISAFLGGQSASPEPVATTARSPDVPQPDLGIKLSRLGLRHVSAYVERVRPDSPAAEAGIQPDDLILQVGDRRIASADEYNEAIRRLVPGQTIRIILKRGQRLRQLNLTVGEKP